MPRKIRRVPPNWEHPKTADGKYVPLLDRPYSQAIAEWEQGLAQWEQGQHPDQLNGDADGFSNYEDYCSPAPIASYYRPDWEPEVATWFQLYEETSEGTPLSPAFASAEELIDWIAENPDFGGYRWRRESIENMVARLQQRLNSDQQN